jgi:serine/threonine protein kinase
VIDKDTHVTLIDFENSKTSPSQINFERKDEISEFTAPEFLEERYDGRSDVWSLGVLMYYLLSRGSPFKGDKK